MKQRFAMIVLACGLAAGVGGIELACRHTPPSVTTPQGKVAYQAEDALDAIGALQHAAIVARRAGAIETPAMRTVVKATVGAARSINAAIDNGSGAAAAYRDALTALTEAQAALPPAVGQKVAVEFAAAQTILTALAAKGDQ